MNYKYSFTSLFLFLVIITYGQSDTTGISREKALNIYIDCDYCDIQYFKENFTLVNYVRDRKEADAQIIITEMETGSGGTEYTLEFLGRNRFEHIQDTLVFSLPADFTDDEERETLLKNIKLGLVPYILKTPFKDKLSLSINTEEEIQQEKDPWHNWVFNIYGRAYGQKEKTYSHYNISAGLYVNKVTNNIKVEFNLRDNYSESRYKLYDENDSLVYDNRVITRGYDFSNLVTWSVGDHWGVGWVAGFGNSSYRNLQLKVDVKPAFEYNIFPYSEATRKQFRFIYAVGFVHTDYIDTTIYNVLHDNLFEQQMGVMFKYVSKWGSIEASVSGSNYLNDFSFYSVEFYLGTSVRIVKGLSVEFYGTFEMPHNQIALRGGGTTPEEILTRQHEMQSFYSVWLNVGITYTFGSIYNNVVNPRFDF